MGVTISASTNSKVTMPFRVTVSRVVRARNRVAYTSSRPRMERGILKVLTISLQPTKCC